MNKDNSRFNYKTVEEMEDDIRQMQQGKADYEAELDVLNGSPVANKERIQVLTGQIQEHNTVINFLTTLLEHKDGDK